MKFVNARINYIIDDTLLPEYLPPGTRATNVRYIRFAKLFIKDIGLLPLLERLSTKGGTGKNLSISHLNCLVLYSSEP